MYVFIHIFTKTVSLSNLQVFARLEHVPELGPFLVSQCTITACHAMWVNTMKWLEQLHVKTAMREVVPLSRALTGQTNAQVNSAFVDHLYF